MGVFAYFGGTESGTSGARIKILRPLFNTRNPADDGVSGSQAEASSNGGKITTASAQERLLTSIHPQACQSFSSLQAPVELPHLGK